MPIPPQQDANTRAWTPVPDDTASAWQPVQETQPAAAAPPAAAPKDAGTFSGAVDEGMNYLRGMQKIFSPPKGAAEWASTVLGPEVLPLAHVAEGAWQNEKQAAGQVKHYAQETTKIPWTDPAAKMLEGARAGVTGISMLNPLAPGGVANLNQKIDEGKPDEARGAGIVDASMMYLPELAGKGMVNIAPKVAEQAVGIRALDRAHGSTPGTAILNDTRGIRPETIAESGRQSMKGIQQQQRDLLDNFPGAIDLEPTRNVANDFYQKALAENHAKTLKDVSNLGRQVDTQIGSGEEIPRYIPASRAAALNRGISAAKTSWNPATASDTMNAAAGSMYHQLGEDIASQVPEIRPLNQRIQSLMPVIQRASGEGLKEGLTARTIGRFGAHTGATSGAVFALSQHNPILAAGAIVGPELLFNPDARMFAARSAYAAGQALPKIRLAQSETQAEGQNDKRPLFFAPQR